MPSLRFVIGVIVLLLVFYGLANAQTTQPAARAGRGEMAKRLTDALDKLDLTPDEKTQVDAVKQEMAEQIRTMAPSLKGLSEDERREKMQTVRSDFREKLAAVLTPEQLKQFRSNLQAGGGAKAEKPEGRKPLADLKKEQKADGDPPLIAKLRAALDKVGLTVDQKPQATAICDDAAAQIKQLRADAAGDPDGVRDKIVPIFQGLRTKLSAVLTDEQKQKLADEFPRFGKAGKGAAKANGQGQRGRDNNSTPTTKPTDPTAANAAAASSPAVAGRPAPAFTLARLTGSSVTNKTYFDKSLVLVFASYTSPSLRDRLPALQTLQAKNRYKASVVLVYTREAHPADGWQVSRNTDDHVELNQPQTAADRLAAAKLLRDKTKTPLDVVVDDMDDTVAAAYGASSDTAVVISPNGVIVGRQQWCDPSGVQRMIDEAGKTPAKPAAG